MTDARKMVIAFTLYTAFVFAGGLAAGYRLYHSESILEGYAPPVEQRDGSVILKRDPEAKPDAPAPKLPGKVERTVVVKVKPKPEKKEPTKPDQSGLCPVLECPALTVRLDLIQQEEGRRVVASSPDGDIVGGIDIPIEKWIKRNENKWAAGVTYDTDRKPGAFLDRDLGPFRVGVEADAEVVRVRAGIRF
jgi:hypothetical protein